MTATVSPTPIPGSTPCSTSLRISCAPPGSSPTAVLDPLSGLFTGGLTNRANWPAAPGAGPFGGPVQPTPVSALWLMAAGRGCLRTSHVHRLMVDAARLRTMSETDSAVQAAWDSEEDREVRYPAARPQIPAVSAPSTAR
ncbi:hypothetical protein JG491_33680 [Streptomyces sp. CRPSP2-6A1]|nr:hypothetical protein [Streptomyces sp. CRPSP2-6A1]